MLITGQRTLTKNTFWRLVNNETIFFSLLRVKYVYEQQRGASSLYIICIGIFSLSISYRLARGQTNLFSLSLLKILFLSFSWLVTIFVSIVVIFKREAAHDDAPSCGLFTIGEEEEFFLFRFADSLYRNY